MWVNSLIDKLTLFCCSTFYLWIIKLITSSNKLKFAFSTIKKIKKINILLSLFFFHFLYFVLAKDIDELSKDEDIQCFFKNIAQCHSNISKCIAFLKGEEILVQTKIQQLNEVHNPKRTKISMINWRELFSYII